MTPPDRAVPSRAALSFLGTTRLVGGVALAVLVLVAGLLDGARASAAALVGAGLGFAALETLAAGLFRIVRDPARTPAGGALLAGVTFVLRHALIASGAFVALRVLALPASWLLSGVTLLPIALTTAGLLASGIRLGGASRPAAGAH